MAPTVTNTAGNTAIGAVIRNPANGNVEKLTDRRSTRSRYVELQTTVNEIVEWWPEIGAATRLEVIAGDPAPDVAEAVAQSVANRGGLEAMLPTAATVGDPAAARAAVDAALARIREDGGSTSAEGIIERVRAEREDFTTAAAPAMTVTEERELVVWVHRLAVDVYIGALGGSDNPDLDEWLIRAPVPVITLEDYRPTLDHAELLIELDTDYRFTGPWQHLDTTAADIIFTRPVKKA